MLRSEFVLLILNEVLSITAQESTRMIWLSCCIAFPQ